MVLVGAVAISASACTSSSPPETATTTEPAPPISTTTTEPPTTTTTEPLPQHPVGGEVIIAYDGEPPTLNSFMPGGDQLVVELIGQAYAAGVYEIDGNTLTLVPELVTELPTVANGGVVLNVNGTMTVKYTIRSEAQWDDGTPISGDDFQFTLDTIMNPDYPISKTNYQDIITSTAGAKTFEYTMDRPTILYELMFDEIIPKHSVEGTDFLADWNDTRWVSSGPFIFEEWAKGEFITLRRNPNYWKVDAETEQQLPYLESVIFAFMADTPSMIEAFKARDIDVFSPRNPTIEDIEALQAVEPQGARVEVLSGPQWEHLNFQFGPGRLDRNENSCNEVYEMRLAVAQTVDKNRLTRDLFGGKVEPLASYVDAFSPTMSQEAWSQYSFDPDAAAGNYAKAIEATGKECSVVFTTTLSSRNDTRARMSELFVDMFAASGIAYENQLEDNTLFFGETLSTGSWDLGEWAWVGSPGFSGLIGIHDVFDPGAPPPIGSNYYRWGTTELADEEYEDNFAVYAGSNESSVQDAATVRFAEVRDAMNATVDETELLALINEAENILADNLVIIPLYARPVTAAVWEDEIGGFKHNPSRAGFTWNIEFWHRNDL
jgi:peptide/nickel transport system substrate-binding protein